MTALGRPPISADEAGELYRIGPEPQPTLLVKICDRTGGADGALRQPLAPGAAARRDRTEAVAWTFGTGERHYRPGVES